MAGQGQPNKHGNTVGSCIREEVHQAPKMLFIEAIALKPFAFLSISK